MIKQDCPLVNECHCQEARNEYRGKIPCSNRPQGSAGENCCAGCGCECSRPDSYRPDCQQDKPPCLDRQTLDALTSFRQRACQFINSETEATTSSSAVNCANQPGTGSPGNGRNEGNALQKAQESINYTPVSAFLKKLKEKFPYVTNNQETQNVIPTYNHECDFIPVVCDKCVAKSKQILKLSEQLNTGRTKHSTNDSKNNNKSYRSEFTDQPSRTSGIDFIEKTCRNAVEEYQRSLGNIAMIKDDDNFCPVHSNLTQPMNQNKTKEKKSTKKSHHLSRSKRPKKRFHRRKRKSNDSGDFEPRENFEPTLKRPHENSCERCWRYASPARSPVNKPDQRFDPNFRRAHSATDFPLTDEDEKSDYDNQENSNQKPSIRRRETNSPQPPVPVSVRQHCFSNTQLNDLINEPLQPSNEPPIQSGSDRRYQRVQNVPDSRANKTPENQGIIYSAQKPRPKVSVPGGSRPRGRCLSFDLDDLDVTQYKEVAVGSNRQDQNRSDNGRKSVRSSLEREPPSEEHQPNTRGSFERSRSSPKYSPHSRTSRNNDGSDLETGRIGPVQVDPNRTLHSSHREMPPNSRRSPHTPARVYSGIDKGNQCSLNKQHESHYRGKEDLGTEPPSQTQLPFQALPAARTHSSGIIQERSPRFEKQKPHSAGFGMTGCNCLNYQNINPAFGLEMDQGKLRPHPFQPCECRTQQTQTEGIEYPAGSYVDNNICCHCRRIGSSGIKSNRPNGSNTRRDSQDGYSHYGPPTNRDSRSSDKHFPSNPDPPTYNQRHISSYRNGNVDSDSQEQSDRIILCPYRQFISNKGCLRNHNRMGSYEARDDENCLAANHQNYRNGACKGWNCNPNKYCVFYMTKNKEDTGSDVEVLIEEFTQNCSRGTKGSKAKSLKEKMKRLMECQSDSMALRFQKGMSDTGRNSQSSRVLYF